MKKIILSILCIGLCVHVAKAQWPSDEARGVIHNVSRKLNISEQEMSDMLKSADSVIRDTQTDLSKVAAFTEDIEWKEWVKEDVIKNFRYRDSPVEESNKSCYIKMRGAEQYVNRLGNRSGRIGQDKIKNIVLTWGDDVKVTHAKTLEAGKAYYMRIVAWQFYFKQILQAHGYSLDVDTPTKGGETPDSNDWIDADAINDAPMSSQETDFKEKMKQAVNIFNLMNDSRVTYSDATKKAFTILCIRQPNGTWTSKIVKISASCAIDVETYQKLHGNR